MYDPISNAISNAGDSGRTSTVLRQMLQQELTPDMQLPPMEFLMRLFGEPCFPRRELVAITGRAKSGKTFVISIVILMGLIRQALQFERDGDDPLKVMWFDTEQSQQSTLDIIQHRIVRMYRRAMGPDSTFPNGNLRTFNVRFENCESRRQGFRELVPYIKPDLVILDGIRDLVADINDGAEAQRIIDDMLSLAQANNCCIVTVLHQNKSGDSHDPRGWLGTELLNKAFDVFATEKLKIKDSQSTRYLFKLEQLYTRKYDISQDLYFEIGDDGLPFETDAPPMPVYMSATRMADDSAEEQPQLNDEYIVHHANGSWDIDVPKLFTEAFECNPTLTGSALRFKVKTLANMVTNRLYNNCLNKAMKLNLMKKDKDKNGTVIYELNVVKPQPAANPQQLELFEAADDNPPPPH